MPSSTRLPAWLRRPTGLLKDVHDLKALLRSGGLHTVCESARCPNIGECFRQGTATFLLLGDRCTRSCGFCAVDKGSPLPPDPGESNQVARAAGRLALKHVVLTMVTRDDLPDGGAEHVAETVRVVRLACPGASIEVLISDLKGDPDALQAVLSSSPDVLNHNMETVKRLYPKVRPQADYRRSLELFRKAAALNTGCVLKSGLMVGLSESFEEVEELLLDLRDAGCSIITVGQYLRAVRTGLPVDRFWQQAEFDEIEKQGKAIGFKAIIASPYVRSSFNAGLIYRQIKNREDKKFSR
ncbi:lipoyl synthase [Acidobacteriota bacterium]